MIDLSLYTFSVVRDDEHGHYIGMCKEFPMLYYRSVAMEMAMHGIRGRVRDIFDDECGD